MKVDTSRRGILADRWHRASNSAHPPQSGDGSHFLIHCIRYDACISVCENSILRRDAGGYPSANFENDECSFCHACVQACPESLFSPRRTRVWNLQFTTGDAYPACQSVERHRCQDNYESMVIISHPTLSGIYQLQLSSQLCSGCGVCTASCPMLVITAEYPHTH